MHHCSMFTTLWLGMNNLMGRFFDDHFYGQYGRINGCIFCAWGHYWKECWRRRIEKGYRAEGLAVILGGYFQYILYTRFSQNVGLFNFRESNEKTYLLLCVLFRLFRIFPKSVLAQSF